MMITGGAYMLLLENAPRTTDDVDVFWLEEEAFQRAYEQAKQLLDCYILSKAQEEHAEQIERSLNKLFKNQ
jgi:DNA-binding MarR family transcriptional regulator